MQNKSTVLSVHCDFSTLLFILDTCSELFLNACCIGAGEDWGILLKDVYWLGCRRFGGGVEVEVEESRTIRLEVKRQHYAALLIYCWLTLSCRHQDRPTLSGST